MTPPKTYAGLPGAMSAPVHLPEGAKVTSFKVFFYDNSSSDLSVSFGNLKFVDGERENLATVSSSKRPKYSDDTATLSHIIDNQMGGYYIRAWCDTWDGPLLRIQGAVITYELSEAP